MGNLLSALNPLSLIGDVIEGATSIFNTHKTNKANKDIADATNQANLELAEKQNQWNIDQWERNNQYNDPSAQLERFRNAGINPFFQGGTVEAVPSAPLTSAPMANQMPYQMQNPDLSAFGNLAQHSLEAAKINLDKQRVKNETIHTDLAQKEFSSKMRAYADQHKESQERVNNLIKQNEKLGKESLELDQTIKRLETENKQALKNLEWTDAFKDQELKNLAKQYEIEEAQVRNIAQQTFNAVKQGKLLDQEFTIGDSTIKIKQSEARVASVEADNTEDNKEFDLWMGRCERGVGLIGDIIGSIKNGLIGHSKVKK